MNKIKEISRKKGAAFLIWVFWGSVLLLSSQAYSAEALNMRLIGHSDLQGRDSLQVVLKGNYAYLGHHRGEEFNPMIGKVEPDGTKIVDVSNPLGNPKS